MKEAVKVLRDYKAEHFPGVTWGRSCPAYDPYELGRQDGWLSAILHLEALVEAQK